ncbi:hypothetical protein QBC43DRAFT_248238 [Cladorrhinum sp. PSN259]|nr:hypothetical protein QBC43DRAFT_248238 [Cladorrhinum sp. PSN259]
MAPTKPIVEHVIDRTPEYEKFIEDLRVWHEKRGTPFDPEPKMGNLSIDLLKLFNYIVENGGYDKVSDEKLMWRKMCEGLGLMRHNAPADAYTLKQIFYKYLASWEIKTVHKKEPPPPEILEFTTAKGGGLLTRTVENYQARIKTDREESEDGTPSRERPVADTPSSSARASRGLREAPAPRVIFHPDTNSSRQTRHASGGQQTGTPGSSNSHSQQSHPQQHPHQHPHSHSSTPIPVHSQNHPPPARGNVSHMWGPVGPDSSNPMVTNYQPAPLQAQALPFRIVDTPASNPDLFMKKQRLARQPPAPLPPVPNPSSIIRASIPPGTLDGPNIYDRCLLALRSGIRAEQAFGAHHLLKISFERGDKYKFSAFCGLAEGLTEFSLGVGNMFYHVNWTVCYDPDYDEGDIGELDGINGTPDILGRIARLQPKDVHDNFQPSEFTDRFNLILETTQTIRNMVMMPDNALFIADYPPIRDLLCILLHLPPLDLVVELKHLALEIAEQIVQYLVLDQEDPLYKTLLEQLESTDRGVIVTSLRALNRISLFHPTETNKLCKVPATVIENLRNWLLLNDEDLLDMTTDFLYQYTAVVENLDTMIKSINMEHLVTHLVRLLSHGAKRSHREFVVSEAQVAHEPPSENVVPTPRDLLDRLLALNDQERCCTWIKCFFVEDADSHITQLAIWQAYNAAFLEPLKRLGRQMITAPEFIKNITTVYPNSFAHIVQEPNPNGQPTQRYLIRGIRPRQHPIGLDGRGYFQCKWNHPSGNPHIQCPIWHCTAQSMWEHILEQHLNVTRGPDGKYQNREGVFHCAWAGCRKYPAPGTKLPVFQLMAHLKIHLKEEEARHQPAAQEPSVPTSPARQRSSSSSSAGHASSKPRIVRPAKTITVSYEETASVRDERNPNVPPQPAGIPLSAVLILRNIARNIVKTESEQVLVDKGEKEGWNERLFRPVMPRLWEIFTENRLLTPYITSLFELVEREKGLFASSASSDSD